tara:strand:- start:1091 stop:1516 length:426 start_codon:yes stop_codon:yes gene_type:complete
MSMSCKSHQNTIGNSSKTKETTMDDGITEKYWKLIELNGQSVETRENRKEIHMILKDRDSLVTGFGGCNSLSGTYALNKAQSRLNFSGIRATLMACEDMETEQRFHAMLLKIDNYTLKKDTLSLNRARMAPLAKFKVVYLK